MQMVKNADCMACACVCVAQHSFICHKCYSPPGAGVSLIALLLSLFRYTRERERERESEEGGENNAENKYRKKAEKIATG